MKNIHGFTVIELCVVVALFAISLQGFIASTAMLQRHKITQFLNSVAHAIQSASIVAINSGAACEITISPKEKQLTTHCPNLKHSTQSLSIPEDFDSLTPNFGGPNSQRILTHESGSFTAGSLSIQRQQNSCSLILSLYGAQRVECQ